LNVSGGNILVGGLLVYSSSETLAIGDGSVNITSTLSIIDFNLTTDGGADSFTLAASSVVGQIKVIISKSADAGDFLELAPTNIAGVATLITFDAIGESVTLISDGTSWHVIGINGATIT